MTATSYYRGLVADTRDREMARLDARVTRLEGELGAARKVIEVQEQISALVDRLAADRDVANADDGTGGHAADRHAGQDAYRAPPKPPLGASRKHLSRLDATILEGVASGLSSVRISVKLHMSRQAIDYHIASMLRSVQAVNRAHLVAKAYATGLLAAGRWPPEVAPERIKEG